MEIEELEDSPRQSFLSVLQPNTRLHEHISNLPEELFELNEDDLQKEAKPTDVDWALRHFFWKHYWTLVTSSEKSGTRIPMVQIYQDVCSRKSFFSTIAKPHKLAFILRPIRLYDDELDVQFTILMARMSQIAKLPIEKDSSWDPQKANVMMRAASMVFDRKLGQTLARSLSLNVNKNQSLPKKKFSSAQELEDEIKRLQQKMNIVDVGGGGK